MESLDLLLSGLIGAVVGSLISNFFNFKLQNRIEDRQDYQIRKEEMLNLVAKRDRVGYGEFTDVINKLPALFIKIKMLCKNIMIFMNV